MTDQQRVVALIVENYVSTIKQAGLDVRKQLKQNLKYSEMESSSEVDAIALLIATVAKHWATSDEHEDAIRDVLNNRVRVDQSEWEKKDMFCTFNEDGTINESNF